MSLRGCVYIGPQSLVSLRGPIEVGDEREKILCSLLLTPPPLVNWEVKCGVGVEVCRSEERGEVEYC